RQKASQGRPSLALNEHRFLVPTARLELAQLSPLPPQDSVSTNSTTSALALDFNRFRYPISTNNCAITRVAKRFLPAARTITSESDRPVRFRTASGQLVR